MSADRIRELIGQFSATMRKSEYEWRALTSGYVCPGVSSAVVSHEPEVDLSDDAVRAERQMLGVKERCRLCKQMIWREVRR